MEDRSGWIAGSLALRAGLSEKDVEKSRACLRLAAVYFSKGTHMASRDSSRAGCGAVRGVASPFGGPPRVSQLR